MVKALFARPGTVFATVFLWKVALLLCLALPVPSNDSFFYDGPVVNLLLHGKYANPALAPAFPISGAQMFCAYPPLYQAVLLAWMSLFGASVISAMALHLVLFGLYMLILLAIFRRLRAPAWPVAIAGAFLLAITFHDRPDSLAHVFGLAAIYGWVRSRPSLAGAATPPRRNRIASDACNNIQACPDRLPPFGPNNSSQPAQRLPAAQSSQPASRLDYYSAGPATRWAWAMAGLAVLSLVTSLQIGAFYCLLLWAGVLAASLLRQDKFPYAPMLAMAAVPAALVGLVAFGFPQVWAGFLEHARQTPSLTGWRWPQLDELLKVVRNAPGILAAAALLPWLCRSLAASTNAPARPAAGAAPSETPGPLNPDGRRDACPTTAGAPVRSALSQTHPEDTAGIAGRFGLITVTATLAALVLVAASLFLLTPNSVLFAGPLQPLIVGGYLALLASRPAEGRRVRTQVWLFLALAALASIRAVGMTTWGAACAADVGCPSALRRVETELNGCAPGNTVVLSSAYLYAAARHQELRWIHSDWMEPAQRHRPSADWQGLLALRPARIILTQFDYYRRYQPLLAQLQARPDLAQLQILNTAKVPAPDSIRPLQRVLQHIAWAPVVVTLSWK
ncbi:MAG: hypothetical protein ABSF95_08135 [Verrucomicrobiota bacterium]|jgi:hypothetical protein